MEVESTRTTKQVKTECALKGVTDERLDGAEGKVLISIKTKQVEHLLPTAEPNNRNKKWSKKKRWIHHTQSVPVDEHSGEVTKTSHHTHSPVHASHLCRITHANG